MHAQNVLTSSTIGITVKYTNCRCCCHALQTTMAVSGFRSLTTKCCRYNQHHNISAPFCSYLQGSVQTSSHYSRSRLSIAVLKRDPNFKNHVINVQTVCWRLGQQWQITQDHLQFTFFICDSWSLVINQNINQITIQALIQITTEIAHKSVMRQYELCLHKQHAD